MYVTSYPSLEANRREWSIGDVKDKSPPNKSKRKLESTTSLTTP